MLASFSGMSIGNSKPTDQRLQDFKALRGSEKVAVVFRERFHGRSLLFWRRSAEVWRTAADARLAFEEEILVASADPQIDDSLATEIQSADVDQARYAVFLECLRARFVPQSEFPVKEDGAYNDGRRSGDISPFRPNLDQLSRRASKALQDAVSSPDTRLRTTAKLYTFSLLDELSGVPTSEVTRRWRTELVKLPCYSYIPLAFSEPEQSVFLLERSLASRGLEAVGAISSLLKSETNPALRHNEIEMLRFLDLAAVRLRGSPEGREAISIVERASAKDQRYCGHRLYQTEETRRNNWKSLEGQFIRDEFESGLSSWGTLIAVALDQEYGDHFSVPFFEKGTRISGPSFRRFLSEMTKVDPTFPGWEFPSTTNREDMLNPAFHRKIRRYHEAWTKITPDH